MINKNGKNDFISIFETNKKNTKVKKKFTLRIDKPVN